MVSDIFFGLFAYKEGNMHLFQNNIDGAKGIKVENILKGSLDTIPSPSVKIQIMGKKVCLRCKGKTLMGDVNKFFVFKHLVKSPSNVLPLHLKQMFLPII